MGLTIRHEDDETIPAPHEGGFPTQTPGFKSWHGIKVQVQYQKSTAFVYAKGVLFHFFILKAAFIRVREGSIALFAVS